MPIMSTIPTIAAEASAEFPGDPDVDGVVQEMVRSAGRIDLAAVLDRVRRVHPDVTSFELAQSVSRLHRTGTIRIDEELTRVHGEQIRTAVLSRP